MDMQPIQPSKPLTATLTAQEWNTVMTAVNELPHRVARPIIDNLGQQLQQQVMMSPADVSDQDNR